MVRVFGPSFYSEDPVRSDCLDTGHMNHDTADHVSTHFGPYLKSRLESALRSRPSPSALPKLVSDILKHSLEHIDGAMISEFLALFPREPNALTRLDPARARRLVNEKKGESSGYSKTARAFGGTTALVTLVNPTRSHLWVANVGDCVAGRSPRCCPNFAFAPAADKRI